MSDSPDSLFSRVYRCHDCGSEIGFRSRRRTFSERFILPIFLYQPVRCGECFRRDYWPIFTSVRPRLDLERPIAPKAVTTAPKRNVA
jgi:DNA-directed RNA polymerase subunit RPC12/RpoP